MERKIYDKNILNDFCIKFCKVIEKYTKYIIVSGFVAIASGRTRGTEDIDIIIERVNKDVFNKMHNDLKKNSFIAIQGDNAEVLYEDYLSSNLSLRYTLSDRPLPEIELKFVKDLLDGYQLKTRTKLPLTGLDLWFSSINMNVAFKEEYLKSPKDIEDAKHLRFVYQGLIDEKEINKIKQMIKRYRLWEMKHMMIFL